MMQALACYDHNGRPSMNIEMSYQQTPIQIITDRVFKAAGIDVSVKREDLNHPQISGNKWWKLKLNLQRAIAGRHDTLLTFGGAYSNHIYATAAAAHEMGLKSVGVIRGEEILPLNETLAFAIQAGMKLHYVSREHYRNKTDPAFIEELNRRFGRFYLINEGGSNELGVAGMALFAKELPPHFDYIICPVGTGASLAGLVRGREGSGQIIGIPVLKGGDSWRQEVENFTAKYHNWQLFGDYHFGGYARSTPVLEQFIQKFQSSHGIPIEPVYSAKMFYALYDLASKGFFPVGSKVLAIHTGGLRHAPTLH
jgi:1-aminocyclopropane-1-carboxylate deaminase